MFALRHLSLSPTALGAWSLLLGTALWFAPPHLVTTFRAAWLDGLRPGLHAVEQVRHRVRDWQTQRQEAHLKALQQQVAQLQEATARSDERLRRLSAQFALQQEAPDNAVSAASGKPVPALFVPALVEARVIGDTLGTDWRSGKILEAGWQAGVREQALVLKSRRPLIDLGAPEQLSPEDPLIIGSTVVGKVEVVGRWTSSFLPVTDPDFRGAVQIVRFTDNGTTWGAKGIVKGNGDDCVIEGVGSDAAVRAGDLVYSAGRDGAIDAPLFYGTIHSAELGSDDREWRLHMTPGDQPSSLTHVRVLRAALNPQRLWAH